MEDLLQELLDSQTPESQPETPVTKSDVVAKAEFDKVFARAKKAEEENKLLKEKQPGQVIEFDVEDVVNLRMDGFSKEEIETMKALARGRGTRNLTEIAGDAFVQAGINGLRSKSQTQAATPSPSSRPIPVNPQTRSFKDMNEDERKANFSSVAQKFSRSGRSHE